MITRAAYVNTTAAAPAGKPTLERFLLRAAGTARVDAASATLASGNITAFVDPVTGASYASSADPFVTVATVNGISVADFATPSAAPGAIPSGAILTASLAQAGAYTMLAVFKEGAMTAPDNTQFIMAASAISGTTTTFAAIRMQGTSPVLNALANRAVGGTTTVTPSVTLTAQSGWRAAAVEFDFTGNSIRIHDLLTDALPAVTAIAGTSGAAPTGVVHYVVGARRASTLAPVVAQRFTGQIRHAAHLPYALDSNDLLALRIMGRALVGALAA